MLEDTNMDKVKQVIVFRKDIKLSKGQIVVQGAHASIAFLTNLVRAYPDDIIPFYKCEEQWINGTFYMVCLAAKDEKELLDIGHQAVAIGLKVYYIQENDLFDEPTITCIAIGPNYSSIIDPVTKHLKLL